jgi:hypothetical protein
VAIKRLSQDTKKSTPGDATNDNNMSVEAFYVEQLPPYAGFDANSRACVALHPAPPAGLGPVVLIRLVTRGTTGSGLPVGWMADVVPEATLRPGDVIEVNGTQYELLRATDGFTNIRYDSITGLYFTANRQGEPPRFMARPVNDSGQLINPTYDNIGTEIRSVVATAQRPYWTGPAAYKVFRRPTPTSDEPYQMPEGTAIDLRASGVGNDRSDQPPFVPVQSWRYFYVQGEVDNADGIMLMFSPEGRLSRVTYCVDPEDGDAAPGILFDQPVVDSVYLLVGRRDKITPEVSRDPTLDPPQVSAAVTDDQKNRLREPINWLSDTSRWIVIAPQTGRITTIENGYVDLAASIQKFVNATPPVSPKSEELRTAQILEAREFTREMGLLRGR